MATATARTDALDMGAHLDETPWGAAARKKAIANRILRRADPLTRLRGARNLARLYPHSAWHQQHYGELLQTVVSPVFLPADRAPVAYSEPTRRAA